MKSIAGIISHEFAHTLAQHTAEQTFHISNIFFWFTMLFLGDVIITPYLQSLFEKKVRYVEWW